LDKQKQNMKILYWGYLVIIIIMVIIMLCSFINLFLYMGGITYTGDLGNGTTIEITPLEALLASSFGSIISYILIGILAVLLFALPVYGIVYLFNHKFTISSQNKNNFEALKYLIIAQLVCSLLIIITGGSGFFSFINFIIVLILIFVLKNYIKKLN